MDAATRLTGLCKQSETTVKLPPKQAEQLAALRNTKLARLGVQGARFTAVSLSLLLVKIGLTEFLSQYMSGYWAYAIVHIVIFISSFLLHGNLTFKGQAGWKQFAAFTRAVMGIKVVDYLLFSVLYGKAFKGAGWSALLASVIIFVVRFFAVRSVFHRSSEPAADPLSQD